MAARENQAKQLIFLVLAAREIKAGQFLRAAMKTSLQRLRHRQERLLVLPRALPADAVNRLAAGGGGQPATGIGRNSLGLPMLKCLDERVLDGLFRQADIAEAHGKRSADRRGLLAVRLLEFGGIVHACQCARTLGGLRTWGGPPARRQAIVLSTIFAAGRTSAAGPTARLQLALGLRALGPAAQPGRDSRRPLRASRAALTSSRPCPARTAPCHCRERAASSGSVSPAASPSARSTSFSAHSRGNSGAK